MSRPPTILRALSLITEPMTFPEICVAIDRIPDNFKKNFWAYVSDGIMVAQGKKLGAHNRMVTAYVYCDKPVPRGPRVRNEKGPGRPKREKAEKPAIVAENLLESALKTRTLLELAWSGSALELMATMQPSEMASGPQA